MYGSYCTTGSNRNNFEGSPRGAKKSAKDCEPCRLPVLSKVLITKLALATIWKGPAALATSGGSVPVSPTPPNRLPKKGAGGFSSCDSDWAIVQEFRWATGPDAPLG